MPRSVPPEQRKSHQVLLRLTDHDFDTLRSISHLRGVTPNAYAHELLRDHLARLADNQFVRDDQQNRRAFDAAHADVVAMDVNVRRSAQDRAPVRHREP